MRFYHWLYVGLLLSLTTGRILQKITTDTGGFVSRYVPLIVALILLTGFISYAKQKPLFKRWCWEGILWLSVASSAALLGFAMYLLLSLGGSGLLFSGFLLLGALLLIPAQLALYRYARCSAALWAKPRVTPNV